MSTENVTKNPDEAPAIEHTRNGVCFRPNVDIQERDEELLVVADVPGVQSDSIDLDFDDGMLTIYAKVPSKQDHDHRYLLREYGVGDYYRTFRVSEAVDATKITAEYADGVLTLHLPKAEAVKPRKIEVCAK
jgi:HSP20 family molecular chaperone IbpA